ncbi:MAG: molybdopterin cofactor-binding domain-containing protein [Gammaproteobacteria bacterium]
MPSSTRWPRPQAQIRSITACGCSVPIGAFLRRTNRPTLPRTSTARRSTPRVIAVSSRSSRRGSTGKGHCPRDTTGASPRTTVSTAMPPRWWKSRAPDGSLRVVRVDTAVDCGRVVNPAGVRAQVEGATIFGLGLALHGELTARDGRVEQSNFGDYRVLRITEAPAVIEAHILPSEAAPSGIGEPPTPTVAPALAAAIFSATGRRIRSLPLQAG